MSTPITSSTASLWLVRHAQPIIDAGVCYGRLDVPANAQHTQRTADALATVLPNKIGLRTSPSQRCQQLATALATHTSTAILDVRLQEIDFGTWEGVPWSEIDPIEIDTWARDIALSPPSKHGEALSTMLARVRQALLESWSHDSAYGCRDVIWITHAGVIRCVHWLLLYGLHLPTSNSWTLPAPEFGQWHTLPWAQYTGALAIL